jgi:hypothetical protein
MLPPRGRPRGRPAQGKASPRGRLLLKTAACSVKTCGRVRPQIRTHPVEYSAVELLAERCYNEMAISGIRFIPNARGYYILEAVDGPTPVPHPSCTVHF